MLFAKTIMWFTLCVQILLDCSVRTKAWSCFKFKMFMGRCTGQKWSEPLGPGKIPISSSLVTMRILKSGPRKNFFFQQKTFAAPSYWKMHYYYLQGEIHKKVTFCYFKNWIHTGRKKCFWHFASFCSNFRQACGLSAKEKKYIWTFPPSKFVSQSQGRGKKAFLLRKKIIDKMSRCHWDEKFTHHCFPSTGMAFE